MGIDDFTCMTSMPHYQLLPYMHIWMAWLLQKCRTVDLSLCPSIFKSHSWWCCVKQIIPKVFSKLEESELTSGYLVHSRSVYLHLPHFWMLRMSCRDLSLLPLSAHIPSIFLHCGILCLWTAQFKWSFKHSKLEE